MSAAISVHILNIVRLWHYKIKYSDAQTFFNFLTVWQKIPGRLSKTVREYAICYNKMRKLTL